MPFLDIFSLIRTIIYACAQINLLVGTRYSTRTVPLSTPGIPINFRHFAQCFLAESSDTTDELRKSRCSLILTNYGRSLRRQV